MPTPSLPDGPLADMIASYLQAIERGESPDRGELLARHPDLAAELSAYFTDFDRMNQLARPLHLSDPSATVGIDAATTEANRIRYFGDYECWPSWPVAAWASFIAPARRRCNASSL